MSTPAERLQRRIRQHGPIPFSEFMTEALYGEGGYYTAEELAIGRDGDYVTGSSLSPLFGRATARLLRRLDEALAAPAELFEAGYGTGAHLAAVTEALERGCGRRLRGWDTVPRPLPDGVARVGELEQVGDGEIEGMVFSYELFDALPVHRLLQLPDGQLGELWVELGDDNSFRWHPGELSNPRLAAQLAAAGVALEQGQLADLSPQWTGLYGRLARRLGRGLLVTCDYGFLAPQLLDSRVRKFGTLACYRRHQVHRNPFLHVGSQDITAHVDFSALIHTGEELGLETVALTRQALWLTACGLFEDLADAGPAVRHEAMSLLAPDGMGEEIRVLVQSRGIDVRQVVDVEMLQGARP